MRTLTLFLPTLALVATVGCGPDNRRIPVQPVDGQVIYDGKPAAGVQVYLYPTNAPMPPAIPANPHAVTGADGRFKVTTYDADDGAPEGEYMVILFWPKETKENEEEEGDSDRFLGWYGPKQSKLKVTVKSGLNSIPAFNLPRVIYAPQATPGIPGRN